MVRNCVRAKPTQMAQYLMSGPDPISEWPIISNGDSGDITHTHTHTHVATKNVRFGWTCFFFENLNFGRKDVLPFCFLLPLTHNTNCPVWPKVSCTNPHTNTH